MAHAPALEAQGYDVLTLMFVTPPVLSALGINDMDHRRLILRAAAGLRVHYECLWLDIAQVGGSSSFIRRRFLSMCWQQANTNTFAWPLEPGSCVIRHCSCWRSV